MALLWREKCRGSRAVPVVFDNRLGLASWAGPFALIDPLKRFDK